ncbi:hypothetical protein [Bartonella bovis]|uniref:transglycosylase SLT domain-containing protein n=1 Tax=Bartonella bovis TaxID=155194 RepID=UPI000C9B2D3E|nr:hypothetical protein [Bartonella bovis]
MRHLLLLGTVVFFLGSCAARPPTYTNNACAILAQKNGFFDNWKKASRNAETRHGIPASIILATINIESGFRHNARPKRTKLLGFIPWKRRSTAYGYAQALDNTWAVYIRSTGRSSARRTNFADSADFVAWYHRQSVRRNGVKPNDAYSLYLNYYMGHSAYARNGGRPTPAIAEVAQRVNKMARRYDQQLRMCGWR